MSELIPCPFCGKDDWYFEQVTDGETEIVCDRCEYRSQTFQTIEDAIKWWETRPIEDALESRIAELEALVNVSEDLYGRIYEQAARIAELEAEVTKCHELQDSYCDRIAELERDFDMLFRSSANKQPRKNTQTLTFEYGMESEE